MKYFHHIIHWQGLLLARIENKSILFFDILWALGNETTIKCYCSSSWWKAREKILFPLSYFGVIALKWKAYNDTPEMLLFLLFRLGNFQSNDKRVQKRYFDKFPFTILEAINRELELLYVQEVRYLCKI